MTNIENQARLERKMKLQQSYGKEIWCDVCEHQDKKYQAKNCYVAQEAREFLSCCAKAYNKMKRAVK